MGAEEVLRAAASGAPLSAIVADGAGASTLGDYQLVSDGLGPVFTSVTWLTMWGVELVSGDPEPTALKQIVKHIRACAADRLERPRRAHLDHLRDNGGT